ncbi:MAG: lysine biosynthesis protein LysW [Candidatus Falkowbacteria bacterium]
MQKALCPNCDSDLIVDDEAVTGDLITCNNCDHDFEILKLHPLNLNDLTAAEE